MRITLVVSSFFVGSLGACLFAAPQAQSAKATIGQQLRSQYALTRVGANGVVTQAGGVLIVQEDGIRAIQATLRHNVDNSIKKGGRIKQSTLQSINYKPIAAYLRFLQVGEKVYITGIETGKETEIVLSLQSCGACNPAALDPETPFRASLTFEFPKGYLAAAEFKEVQETIGRVFAIDNSVPAAPPNPTPAVPTPPVQTGQVAAPASDQPTQPSEPQTITLGETKDQVVAAMGQPDRLAKVGNKEICIYKDMKITLVDGRVSDIQ